MLCLTFVLWVKYKEIGNEGLMCSLRRRMGDKTKATVFWLMNDFSKLQLKQTKQPFLKVSKSTEVNWWLAGC